jgi:CHAT domain-containing protein
MGKTLGPRRSFLGLIRSASFRFLILGFLLNLPQVAGRIPGEHDPGPDTTLQITREQPAELSIPPLEGKVCKVLLPAAQLACFMVDQGGVDLSVTLLDPSGKKLAEYADPYGRRISVSTVSKEGGSYTLALKSLEAHITGSCKVSIVELRPQRPSDLDDIKAEQLFEEGQRLKTDYRAESYRMAIGKFTDAGELWRKAGNAISEAASLRRKAELMGLLGEFVASNHCFEDALGISKAIDDGQGVADALNGLAYNYVTLGKSEESLKLSNESLVMSRAAGYQLLQAGALFDIGYAKAALGHPTEALGVYQEALDIFSKSMDRRGQAHTLTFMGVVYLDMSDLPRALEYEQDRALPIWEAVHDEWGKALALNKLALAYTNAGERQKALDYQRRARDLFRTIGDRQNEAICMNSIGYMLIRMNDLDQALDLYNRAEEVFRSTGDRLAESVTLARIGKIHELRHEDREALDYYRRWFSLLAGLNNARGEAYFWRWTGNIYMHSNLPKALACYQKASQTENKKNDPRGEADTLEGFGTIYYRMGKKEESLDYFGKALDLRKRSTDREGESLTLYNMAQTERDLGNLSQARNHVEQALEITESLRRDVVSPELRVFYFASVRNRYELYTDILMRSREAAGSEDLLGAAFESSENSRGRSLLEVLAESRVDIKAGVDPALVQREKELLDEMEIKEQARIKSLSAGQNDAAESVERELKSLNAEYEVLQDNIKAASPRYAALTHPAPLTLKQIQQRVLDPDTVLLEYSLGEERSFMWAVTESGIKGYTLPPRKDIEQLAKSVYEYLSIPRPNRVQESAYWDKARRLSQMLLGPASSALNRSRIVVVADGALQYIPFGALPVPRELAPAGATTPLPMVVDHEIVTLPSASTLAVLREELSGRKPAPRSVAVFANPIFDKGDARLHLSARQSRPKAADPLADLKRVLRGTEGAQNELNLPPLPATQDEADAIVKLVPDKDDRLIAIGLDATREAAMSASLSQYRIIHFATHGLFDSGHPDRSGIVLSMFDEHGDPRNGVLNLRDIYNLNLPAELVVLSACNTALGKDIDGEGLVGLTRGFMYSGAPRVVASLWRVDDTASAELMTRFYEKILKEKLPPAAALRAAQVEMWKETTWKSPSYWAAFVLQGEWR